MTEEDPEDVLECSRILTDLFEARAISGTRAILCHMLYYELLQWQEHKSSKNVWVNIPNPIFKKAVYLLQRSGFIMIKDIRYETVEDYEKNSYLNNAESRRIRNYQKQTPGLPSCFMPSETFIIYAIDNPDSSQQNLIPFWLLEKLDRV